MPFQLLRNHRFSAGIVSCPAGMQTVNEEIVPLKVPASSNVLSLFRMARVA